ncbi:chemotaxis protein [Candidatus Parabeggiatoa sp. HSG14]|uniref:chemotaxis protein n=1 Tax=Candidatus Parabeggiatoa sp. HSG14 TaxID=3055593 RepID=UPI0025A7E973|nr:chemotaxis protein [Thiotrichales bacterium HSG14]
MFTYLIAMGIILLVLLGWVVVQHFARLFAAKYPELGPAREEGGGCGKNCNCIGSHCARDKNNKVSKDTKHKYDVLEQKMFS